MRTWRRAGADRGADRRPAGLGGVLDVGVVQPAAQPATGRPVRRAAVLASRLARRLLDRHLAPRQGALVHRRGLPHTAITPVPRPFDPTNRAAPILAKTNKGDRKS